MAKTKSDPFAKLKNSPTPPKPVQKQKPKVEVKTKVRKKTGRPSSFDEETGRLTADIPITTLKAMRRAIPDSLYSSQAQFVNAAILELLNKNV